MFGISIYLSSNHDFETTIQQASKNSFSLIFSSLHIPEENPANYRHLLTRLGAAAKMHEMPLILDISAESLAHISLTIDNADQLTDLGVTGLRVDYGLTTDEIAKLAKKIKVYLNASTIDQPFLEALVQAGVNISQVEAFHNYYPKPHTGLDVSFFQKTNDFLHHHGLKIAAFVPGDGEKRQPLFEGLPTLEKHRYSHPFASALELAALGVDHIYIGDPSLQTQTAEQFATFTKNDMLLLDCKLASNLDPSIQKHLLTPDNNRMDPARDLIRLEKSRPALAKLDIAPTSSNVRPIGSILIDNNLFGRYRGEVTIAIRDLPSEPKTNNIGHIAPESIALLPFIKPGQAFQLRLRN
ncbi:outer surface protein [Listeria grandensis FSL F6-0971]|uniref:Outer surface protein n=1 Tax=Listeria grandensis FSL F6-0971 TaxID=1265819 RepID=W7B7R5_9LIST|nr:MupG family TIM beta-alpha barrel fold protein [Listeria grandensis]EUJ21952.1 outer surface protein [Listeria grandensis FSL F6-0971]